MPRTQTLPGLNLKNRKRKRTPSMKKRRMRIKVIRTPRPNKIILMHLSVRN